MTYFFPHRGVNTFISCVPMDDFGFLSPGVSANRLYAWLYFIHGEV